MSTEIKIAPDLEEIVVSDTAISTEWNGGICYKADLKAIRAKMGDSNLKTAFQTGIRNGCLRAPLRRRHEARV